MTCSGISQSVFLFSYLIVLACTWRQIPPSESPRLGSRPTWNCGQRQRISEKPFFISSETLLWNFTILEHVVVFRAKIRVSRQWGLSCQSEERWPVKLINGSTPPPLAGLHRSVVTEYHTSSLSSSLTCLYTWGSAMVRSTFLMAPGTFCKNLPALQRHFTCKGN